jgi:hypothetical protein
MDKLTHQLYIGQHVDSPAYVSLVDLAVKLPLHRFVQSLVQRYSP